ncbi:MAG: hypothetical protein NVS1B13_04120 [Flavisolibacter sp.]
MRKHAMLWLLVFISLKGISQLQLGLFGGISNYQGDLVNQLYISSKSAFGISLNYQVASRFVLRGGFTLAKIAGADSLSNKPYLRLRNLSFQSSITEFSVLGEYYTFNLENQKWSPYFFGGLAVFHFNPYTYDPKGNLVYLKPLSTEGEGLKGYPDSKPYALTQLAVPFGAGIKYVISDQINIGFEVGLRKTFTDYLDDVSGDYADAADLLAAKGPLAVSLAYRGGEVKGGNPVYPGKGSQRGSPKYKDYYYFTGIHLTFNLVNNNSGLRGSKKGYGCPSNPL